MKRSFMILLASMLLVFSLTACGRNDSNNAQTSDDPPTTNQETNTSGQSGSNQNGSIGGQGDAIMGGDSQSGEPGGQNGSTGNQEDSMMNESTTGNAEDQNVGVSYEKMLRNGRVHDTDGLLNDGENSVSGTTGSVKDAAKDVVRSTRNAVNNMTR